MGARLCVVVPAFSLTFPRSPTALSCRHRTACTRCSAKRVGESTYELFAFNRLQKATVNHLNCRKELAKVACFNAFLYLCMQNMHRLSPHYSHECARRGAANSQNESKEDPVHHSGNGSLCFRVANVHCRSRVAATHSGGRARNPHLHAEMGQHQ